jgi:hypothetical protein
MSMAKATMYENYYQSNMGIDISFVVASRQY